MIEAFKILKVDEIHLEHCSLHYKMLDVFNDWKFDGKVSLGVIDQRIDNTETEEDIIKAIKPALEYFPKEKILLTSECGFGHVPIDIVKNKIKFSLVEYILKFVKDLKYRKKIIIKFYKFFQH